MKNQKTRITAQDFLLWLSVVMLCTLATFLFLAVLWVMNADVESAMVSDRIYCENVEQGVWPDYKQAYQDMCKAEASTSPDMS